MRETYELIGCIVFVAIVFFASIFVLTIIFDLNRKYNTWAYQIYDSLWALYHYRKWSNTKKRYVVKIFEANKDLKLGIGKKYFLKKLKQSIE